MTEVLIDGIPEYARAAELDPLGMDNWFHVLPTHNELGNIPWLALATSKAIRRVRELEHLDAPTAVACMRDLDFFASSMVRHGVDPVGDVDGLEPALFRLSEATDTVPRGTVTTYAGANPSDGRQRTFTGSHEEVLFLELVRDSYVQLDNATSVLSLTVLEDVTDPHAAMTILEALETASLGVGVLVNSMVGNRGVMKNITPEYFSHIIRPYFDPLVIGGIKYSAASGGQLPLGAVEYMLWGSDETSDDTLTGQWRSFYEENYPYYSLAQRTAMDIFVSQNGGRSIRTYIAEAVKSGGADPQLLSVFKRIMQQISHFRGPHNKVAADNFKVRGEGAVGSGSHAMGTLNALARRTAVIRSELKSI